MQKFLRDSFARNKPYDTFVFELVSATGSNRPAMGWLLSTRKSADVIVNLAACLFGLLVSA